MKQRKGLGKGLGSGWKNLTYNDPYRHSLSAKGVKSAVSLNMMGLSEIKRLNNEASRKAKAGGKRPFMITSQEQIDNMPPFPFPYIGDYVPTGYVKTNEYFVDSSGFGADDELALSINQFKRKLEIGKSYAITSAGQFQVYIGEYEKKNNRLNAKGKPTTLGATNIEIGDMFFQGAKKGKSNSMQIVETPTETLLVGYGWAVYGARDKATGKVIYYEGWDGYSQTTSKQLSQTGLRAKADEVRPFARRLQ